MSELCKELNEYEKQALEFLEETNTKFKVLSKWRGFAPWDDDSKDKMRDVLRVELSNDKHTYQFNFYTSIMDTYGPSVRGLSFFDAQRVQRKHELKMRKKDWSYDVLVCLNVDYSEDFEDFCEMYGYDTDSRVALETYEKVRKETKNLKKLWTSEELERLNEIN